MLPEEKKSLLRWLLFIICFLLGMAVSAVITYSKAKKSVAEDYQKKYDLETKQRQAQFDSLAKENEGHAAAADYFSRRADTLARRDSILGSLITKQNDRIKQIKTLYGTVHNADTFSRATILGFITDSIPAR